MELRIALENSDQLLSTFRQAPAIAGKEYRIALERIATSVYEKAVKNAPGNKGEGGGKRGYGGNLKQSIRKSPYGATGFIVRVNADYGVYVDQGTKPHVIVPRRAPYLVFKNRDGKWIRTKRVNHPGTKPTYFFTNAVEESGRYANEEMSRAMDRVISQL